MQIGTFGLVSGEPGVFVGQEAYWDTNDNPVKDKLVIQTHTGRSYYEPKLFEPIGAMDMEMAQRFVPLLPETMFSVPLGHGQTGTDPEIFAFDKTGAVIPAWRFLPTVKAATGVYWDGVQGEFTTHPKSCHNYLSDQVQGKLKRLYTYLKRYDPTAILATQDVVQLDNDTLALAADEHINLGCSPSRNVYPDIKPITIADPRKHPYRYAGVHLHHSVMYHSVPSWFPHGTIVMMDKIAGLCLTALGRDMENPKRREAYGRPGEYRLPDKLNLRLEYRTPGAFLLHHPALFNFAADMGRAAYRMGLQLDGRLHPLPDVQDVIMACDADTAYEVINANRSVFEHLFAKLNYNVAGTMKLLKLGARASGLFRGSVMDNWELDSQEDWVSCDNRDTYRFRTFSDMV